MILSVLKLDDAEVAEPVAAGQLVDGLGADVDRLTGAQSGHAGSQTRVNRNVPSRQFDAPPLIHQDRLSNIGLDHLLCENFARTAGSEECQVTGEDVQTVVILSDCELAAGRVVLQARTNQSRLATRVPATNSRVAICIIQITNIKYKQ